jgi:HAD superfamily hydrolase (TIGR01549 family)
MGMSVSPWLTVPNLDFKEMYRRVGCRTMDILSEIDTMSEERQREANGIIFEMEQEALQTMRQMLGAEELGAFFDARGMPRGLVTRNVATSVAHFHRHAWGLPPFHPALARDFKPYKPAPDALLHICAQWGVHPSEVVMIGDSAKDDIVSGNRAGAVTVLLDTGGKWRDGTDSGGVTDNGVRSAGGVLEAEAYTRPLFSSTQAIFVG